MIRSAMAGIKVHQRLRIFVVPADLEMIIKVEKKKESSG
jgi:hypothetical protein